MSDAEDKARVDAALAGDAPARRALVERLLPMVQARVLQALLRHKRREPAEQVAADLTQQVFVRLFEEGGRRLAAWDPRRGAPLLAFVGLLAEREVIDLLRRSRKNPWTEAPTPADELVARAGSAGDQEARLASRELLDAVLDRVLVRLDERGLLLFQRLVVDGVAVDVVASETGSTTAALYMWKSRFAKLARDVAEEMAGEPPSFERGGAVPLQVAWKAR